jgi:Fur family transcriptional regulator, peroxide stress response regulator
MNPDSKKLATRLASCNIRPSIQRIKILEYLINNQCHPSVDQIFQELQIDIPTLSKTTVYNTLDSFFKAGLIKLLNIEENVNRYDIVTEFHGHFKCEVCGSISNFDLDLDLIYPEMLKGFKIRDRNVYFKGICPKCLVNIDNDNRKENSK